MITEIFMEKMPDYWILITDFAILLIAIIFIYLIYIAIKH